VTRDAATATVWDTRTGARTAVLRGHTKRVNSAHWNPDGTRIVTASSDCTARIWNPATGAELAVIKSSETEFRERAGEQFVPKPLSTAIYSTDGTQILLWRSDAYGKGDEWNARTGAMRYVSNLDLEVEWGQRTWGWWEQFPAAAWHFGLGRQVTLEGASGARDGLWSTDREKIVARDREGSLLVWNTESGDRLAVLDGSDIYPRSWSHDGTRVVTRLGDRTAGVWDAQTGERIAVLEEQLSRIDSVVWSPDGKRIVTASIDGTVRVWDPRTGADLLTLDGPAERLSSVSWSSDGRRIMAVGKQKIWVWDACPTGQSSCPSRSPRCRGRRGDRMLPGEHMMPIARLEQPRTVGSSWTRKVEIGPGNTIHILHVASDAVLLVLRGEADVLAGPLRFASFSPDGYRIITAAGPTVTILDATPLGR
jgi:WD40 repeat protein